MIAANNFLALDIGGERVGIAWAHAEVSVPVAITTLLRSQPDFWDRLSEIVDKRDVGRIILGLPRGLDGQETAQTAAVRLFGQELGRHLSLPIHWQDEAVTSIKAETSLKASGKPYAKGDIDALAACYILDDYISSVKAPA
ncbi:MAG TPA: Holliday junction resolvase RuvX [Candidatus Limnocylindrales bacterium]|nr:Holliday junction resolvase RuvX [Candidatus Limnocylindrales bacterium]